MGVEAATIPTDNSKEPEKIFPRERLLAYRWSYFSTFFCCISLFGIMSPDDLAGSVAPLSDAATLIFGGNASYSIAFGASVSTFGILNVLM
jgi:APA family basic amino acid/polyamine antiporter